MRLNGFYRALVVDNNDPEEMARVKVYIPDTMPEVEQDKGIWARPANTPVGGRNDEHGGEYIGSTFIPFNNTYVWIFFEGGNINRPYYWNALNLENAKTLPENRVGSNPTEKWVIFKSTEGRTIVVSDDDDDERTEITGKKRNITEPPAGDTDSVYEIDGNQTTILFDERSGKEKILIRTHKGDFFHLDIDEQKLQTTFKNGFVFNTEGQFVVKAGTCSFKTDGDFNIQAGGSINAKAGANVNMQATGNANLKGNMANVEGSGAANLKAGGAVSVAGASLSLQEGAAGPAGPANPADETTAKGERDT